MAEQTQNAECYKCGATLADNAKICSRCHTLQTIFCRKCKTEFRRDLGRCPSCGTVPLRKRSRAAGRPQRIREAWERVVELATDKKRYLIYIIAGLIIGGIARPILIWLAAFSMPGGWVDYRANESFSFQHFVEPFWAAGKTLGSWAYFAVSSAYQWILGLVLRHPSGAILGFIGAALGFWLAYRKEHKGRR